MKICSKEAGLCAKSSYPKFKYRFPEANVPVEIEEGHAEKILRNPTFYKYGPVPEVVSKNSPVPEVSFSEELQEINGIGEKTAKDIMKIFKTREDLTSSLKSGKEMPFDDDVENKLKEAFLN